MALKSETIKDPIPPVETPSKPCGNPLEKDPPIGEWGLKSGRWIKEDGTLINIADIWHAIYNTIQKAIRVIPIEKNEVRWTTEADFDKGVHFCTKTIPEGGGAVSLRGQAVPDGTYAVWHLNETEGNIANDSSGFERHGTLKKMEDADWVPAKLNNGLIFDGVDELVDFDSQVVPIGAKSIECWIKTSTYNIRILGNNGETTTEHGVELAIGVGGLVSALSSQGTPGTWRFVIEGTTNVVDGMWHHIVFTWDGTINENAVKLYVDNSLEAQTTANTIETVPATHIMQLGHVAGSSAPYFNGYLDEVIIYDKAINQTEVNYRWNGGAGREWQEAGYELAGYYTSNAYDSAYPNMDWDIVCFNVDIPIGTTLIFKVRTADCPGEWGEWSAALANGEDITETGRYIQWKGEFATTDELLTSKVFDLSISYLNQRVNKISP